MQGHLGHLVGWLFYWTRTIVGLHVANFPPSENLAVVEGRFLA
jgi:hypothetical protein